MHQSTLDGRCGGLIARLSAFVFGSSSLGWSPGRGHHVVILGQTIITLTVPNSTHMYEWVPANLLLWITLQWTSIPSRGE